MPVLEPGQRLGAYAIDAPLGRGGMAEVYRATHLALERAVAIKVLNPTLHADPTFPLRFLREARAAARLNHPNIITIYDFNEQGELAYLVMELAPHGTLRDRARQFRTLAEAVAGLAPVCAALQFAHEHGIVHRDVKPLNVLIDEHDRPRLADFGIARIVSESLDFTLLGTSAGSPPYMAPEQAIGGEVEQRTDIYALGIVAYEVIAGRRPYIGNSGIAVIQQHLTAPPPSIRTVLPDAPEVLEACLRRATAKRPEERFATVSEFLEQLQAAAAAAPDLPIRPASAAAGQSGAGRTLLSSPRTADATAELTAALADAAGDGGDDRLTVTRLASDDQTLATALDKTLPRAASAAGPGGEEARPAVPGAAPRRPTAFAAYHWAALSATVFVLCCISAVGLWLAVAGPGASPLTASLARHIKAVTLVLVVPALLLGALNATIMRVAVLTDHHLSLETYRRLRQNHRYFGYTVATTGVAVEVLAVVHTFRLGAPSALGLLGVAAGAALLVVSAAKSIVVRAVPRWRQYLPWFGVTLLALLVAVCILTVVS